MQSSGIEPLELIGSSKQGRAFMNVLERPIARDLECDVLRVHRVHLPVEKIRLHVHDATTGENAFRARDLDPALDRRHEHAVHALAGK